MGVRTELNAIGVLAQKAKEMSVRNTLKKAQKTSWSAAAGTYKAKGDNLTYCRVQTTIRVNVGKSTQNVGQQ
eukprot:15336571-Ditylum_brightwellii.AAC.1